MTFAVVLIVTNVAGQVGVGSVEGTVVDQGGAVIPGALATIEGPEPMAGANTDERGRFVLDAMPPGNYTLRLQVAGFEPKELHIQIEAGKRVALGRIALEVALLLRCMGDFEKSTIHEVRLDSPQKTAISGTAREGGEALGKLLVRLRGPGTSGDLVEVKTDEGGRFRFDGMPPGSYELSVADAGVKLHVEVKKGRGTVISLTWKNLPQGFVCL